MRPRRRSMGRQPVVDPFVRGARAADVKHDVRDQEAEQDRQSCDQDEPREHRREEDEHRMPRAYSGRDAFGRAVTARLEHRNIPVAGTCARATSCRSRVADTKRRLPRRREGKPRTSVTTRLMPLLVLILVAVTAGCLACLAAWRYPRAEVGSPAPAMAAARAAGDHAASHPRRRRFVAARLDPAAATGLALTLALIGDHRGRRHLWSARLPRADKRASEPARPERRSLGPRPCDGALHARAERRDPGRSDSDGDLRLRRAGRDRDRFGHEARGSCLSSSCSWSATGSCSRRSRSSRTEPGRPSIPPLQRWGQRFRAATRRLQLLSMQAPPCCWPDDAVTSSALCLPGCRRVGRRCCVQPRAARRALALRRDRRSDPRLGLVHDLQCRLRRALAAVRRALQRWRSTPPSGRRVRRRARL